MQIELPPWYDMPVGKVRRERSILKIHEIERHTKMPKSVMQDAHNETGRMLQSNLQQVQQEYVLQVRTREDDSIRTLQ